MYSPLGRNGHIDQILFPIQHGILYFCGFEVLPAHIAFSPAHATDEQRAAMLEDFRVRLATLDAAQPIPFHPTGHFDERMQLRPEFQG
jgi:NAD(P)H dehydrogenase (quinone)